MHGCSGYSELDGLAKCRAGAPAVPLGYKWVRINMKTNRIAAPYLLTRKAIPQHWIRSFVGMVKPNSSRQAAPHQPAMLTACSRFTCSLHSLCLRARGTCRALR